MSTCFARHDSFKRGIRLITFALESLTCVIERPIETLILLGNRHKFFSVLYGLMTHHLLPLLGIVVTLIH